MHVILFTHNALIRDIIDTVIYINVFNPNMYFLNTVLNLMLILRIFALNVIDCKNENLQ